MKRMKYILMAILALALAFVMAACGAAQEEALQETPALAQEATGIPEAVLPGPPPDALEALGSLLAGTAPPPQTSAPATEVMESAAAGIITTPSPAASATTRAAGTNTATKTAKAQVTTKYAYTAAPGASQKTTTARPSTASQTTTAAITMPRTAAAGTAATASQARPQSVSVTIANLQAVGKPVTLTMTFANSIDQASARIFTGVRLKEFLAAQGVPVSSLRGVTIRTSDAKMPDTAIPSSVFLSDNTLLAWEENGGALAAPRLCPGDSDSAGDYIKYVVSIGLTY